MAVSPIPQVRKVLDYAVTRIPREKIIMGAPLYGYDWILPYRTGGPPAKRVSPHEVETFALQNSLKIQYNNQDQAHIIIIRIASEMHMWSGLKINRACKRNST